jgi:nitrate reductase gamma subunit
MNENELLSWLRGSGLQIAVAILFLGLVFRIVQNIMAGRSRDLAVARGSQFGPGLRTIWSRSFSEHRLTYRGYFTLIAGYIFHLGFFITLFLLSQHILLFKNLLGISWPALPPTLIDITALLSIAALVAILFHRLMDPVLKQISDYQDYLAWALTILPLATGFMTMHPMGISYKLSLSLHLISVELLLIAIPFTKLSHALSIFVSRWYNGAIAGYKGIRS